MLLHDRRKEQDRACCTSTDEEDQCWDAEYEKDPLRIASWLMHPFLRSRNLKHSGISTISSFRSSYPRMWSACCNLHVIIIMLIIRVLICDIVNILIMSIGVVVGVYVFLNNLFAAEPVEIACTGCKLTHCQKRNTYIFGCLSTTDSPHKASEHCCNLINQGNFLSKLLENMCTLFPRLSVTLFML